MTFGSAILDPNAMICAGAADTHRLLQFVVAVPFWLRRGLVGAAINHFVTDLDVTEPPW